MRGLLRRDAFSATPRNDIYLMKNFIIILFLFTACTATPAPVVVSTSGVVPTSIPPTIAPTVTVEAATPMLAPTLEPSPTAGTETQRVSPVDMMPQVFIPAGTFHMG